MGRVAALLVLVWATQVSSKSEIPLPPHSEVQDRPAALRASEVPLPSGGSNSVDVEKSDAYRQSNPLFETCLERAAKLSRYNTIERYCGNVESMTSCSRRCRASFKEYFRELTVDCWVELIVGLEQLHPVVADHWKEFGRRMDSVCFHPKPEPAPKLPPIPVKPAPNPIRAMFPDSYAPATPDSHPKEAADLLPPAQQNLQGEYGGRFDRVVPAEEPPVVADPQIPDLSAPKIGPQDNILNVKFEKEDGPLPGQDQVAE